MWIDEILSSGYWDDERHKLASRVVLLLGNHLYPKDSESFHYLEPNSIPPLGLLVALQEVLYHRIYSISRIHHPPHSIGQSERY